MPPKITIHVSNDVGQGETLIFQQAKVTLGRDPDSDIEFDGDANAGVSWNHAEIVMIPSPTISDCGSTNGTCVDGERITSPQLLREGSTIRLGSGHSISVVSIVGNTSPAAEPEATRPYPRKSFTPPQLWLLGIGLLATIIAVSTVMILPLKDRGKESVKNYNTPIANQNTRSNKGELIDSKLHAAEELSRGMRRQPDMEVVEIATLTQQEVIGRYQNRLVWFGVTLPSPDGGNAEVSFPWCSGWILETPVAIIEGERAIDLSQVREDDDATVFMVAPAISNQRFRVKSIDFNSRFDVDKPFVASSLANSVAKASIPNFTLTLSLPRKITETGPDILNTEVYILAFDGIENGTPKQYDRFAPPQLKVLSGRIAGTKTMPGSGDDLPLLKVRIDEAPALIRLDGALVVTASGDVLGMVTESDTSHFVVLLDTITEGR